MYNKTSNRTFQGWKSSSIINIFLIIYQMNGGSVNHRQKSSVIFGFWTEPYFFHKTDMQFEVYMIFSLNYDKNAQSFASICALNWHFNCVSSWKWDIWAQNGSRMWYYNGVRLFRQEYFRLQLPRTPSPALFHRYCRKNIWKPRKSL